MMPNSSAAAVSDDTSSGGSNGSNGGGGGSITLKKGPWTAAEDAILIEYVKKYGEGNWNAVQKNSGLQRCGKSCRLRWANHLRPNLKKGSFSPEEEHLILELHAKLGNKWARMAAQLPGRTDNEIKNYWNTRVKRRQRAGLPLYPQDIQKQSSGFHHHHSGPSQSLSSSIPLSSQQHQSNFMTHLSMSDPMSFSTSTPLLSQHNNSPLLSSPILGFKRFRGNNMGYSRSFVPRAPTIPSSSSLYTNNFLPTQNFQFDTNNYNFSPLTMLQSSFETNGLISPASMFPVKMELPSSQISHPGATSLSPDETNDNKFYSSFTSTNSGLLDALLQEAEAMGGKDQARQEGLMQSQNEFLNNGQPPGSGSGSGDTAAKPVLGSGSQWDEASSAQSSAGGETQKEATLDMNNPVEDDELSSLLNSIPTTMMVSELYNESANTSNGQSVADDGIGFDVHSLPSISAAATNSAMDSELTALGAWNNLPGMSC